ncbi:MAG: VWA domain-containing protein [Chloracidobacterium sp.]|nr:VWA domain-containing protein [Chloracidobacterium sp.]
MSTFAKRSLLTICLVCAAALSVDAQTRKLTLTEGGSLDVTNNFGRVGVTAVPAKEDEMPAESTLTAISNKPVLESDIRIAEGRIMVLPAEKNKRIDLILTVPERMKVRVGTVDGAVEIVGNFASVEANTDTGTIVTDVPTDELKYSCLWTESKPRYLANFDIEEVQEKSGGRFVIKGKTNKKRQEKEAETRAAAGEPEEKGYRRTAVGRTGRAVSLKLTTARGIILLNVPPSEVLSDLRERPLTEAAKAIVRSGDSLLTEAIRRASPKYFGDYLSTLPPVKGEPAFAVKRAPLDVPISAIKTATVRVTDLRNRAMDGLDASDFELSENGQPGEIISVKRSMAPVNLVLLLDVSGSVENYVNFIRKAARNFVETVDERDRISIVTFNEDIKKLTDFSTDKTALARSLDLFDAGGGTAYYDALAYTIADTLRPLRGERSAIVILTDGDDNRSFLPFESLAGSVQESGALVYPLYVPSGLVAASETGAVIDPMRMKYMSLSAKSEGEGERLAAISGGVYYPIRQIGQIQQAYDDIVAQLRSAYLITYRSDTTAAGSGVSPKLKIRSKRENTFATVTAVTAEAHQ